MEKTTIFKQIVVKNIKKLRKEQQTTTQML
jgi:hypothetical protein